MLLPTMGPKSLTSLIHAADWAGYHPKYTDLQVCVAQSCC
jgi:hypothetical protein